MTWTVESSTLEYRTNGKRPQLDERQRKMKFYHMQYAASGSDGRFYTEIVIAVDVAYCIAAKAWVRQAALVIGGEPMIFVMGVCPSENWTLKEVSREWWEAPPGRREPVETLFLSDGPPIDGWPEPARLDDLQSGARLAAKVRNRGRHGFHYQPEMNAEPVPA